MVMPMYFVRKCQAEKYAISTLNPEKMMQAITFNI